MVRSTTHPNRDHHNKDNKGRNCRNSRGYSNRDRSTNFLLNRDNDDGGGVYAYGGGDHVTCVYGCGDDEIFLHPLFPYDVWP